MDSSSSSVEPPVTVLIHGVGLDSHMWDRVCSAIEPRPILRYDMLGHGDEPVVQGPFTLNDFVEQLRLLLAAAGIQQCDIVGFSMGALIAQGFALAYPTSVRRMILLNGVFNRTSTQRSAVLSRVHDVRTVGYLCTIDPALDRWFSPNFAAEEPQAVEIVRTRLQRNDAVAYANAYAVFATADRELCQRVGEIRCPTLVVTGSDDQRSTPEMSIALAAAMPSAQVRIIDRARHLTPIEVPAQVAEMIDQHFGTTVLEQSRWI